MVFGKFSYVRTAECSSCTYLSSPAAALASLALFSRHLVGPLPLFRLILDWLGWGSSDGGLRLQLLSERPRGLQGGAAHRRTGSCVLHHQSCLEA